MITPAIKHTAFLFLDRRSPNEPSIEKAMWLWYFFSKNNLWKHHLLENKVSRKDCAKLVKLHEKVQDDISRKNRSSSDKPKGGQ